MADDIVMPRPGEDLSLTQLRRMADIASRSASTMGQSGLSSFNSSSGIGVADRARERFLIQLTRQSTIDPTQYAWQEVIRYNNGYTAPADGRSTQYDYFTGAPVFPAIDINGSTGAIVSDTTAGTFHQYEAWVADDGSCLQFDAGGSSGGSFLGALVTVPASGPIASVPVTILFNSPASYDTAGYLVGGGFSLPQGYYIFGFSLEVQALVNGSPIAAPHRISAAGETRIGPGAGAMYLTVYNDSAAGVVEWYFVLATAFQGMLDWSFAAGIHGVQINRGYAWISKLG